MWKESNIEGVWWRERIVFIPIECTFLHRVLKYQKNLHITNDGDDATRKPILIISIHSLPRCKWDFSDFLIPPQQQVLGGKISTSKWYHDDRYLLRWYPLATHSSAFLAIADDTPADESSHGRKYVSTHLVPTNLAPPHKLPLWQIDPFPPWELPVGWVAIAFKSVIQCEHFWMFDLWPRRFKFC